MDFSDTENDGRLEMGSRISSSSNISNQSFRNRLFGMVSLNVGQRVRDKPICTTPGELCAGETETETDEPVSSCSTNDLQTYLLSSLVATSSNISNHSGIRPSRTSKPTTATVNPTSF